MAVMTIDALPGADAQTRLRRSRAEIAQSVRELQGYRPPPAPNFPRSRLMQSLMRHRGSGWMAAAGLAATLIRPRLVWSLTRWVFTHPVTRRVLMSWLVRRAGSLRR